MSSLFVRRWAFVPIAAVAALAVAPTTAVAEEDPYYEAFFAAHILTLHQAHLAVGVLGDAVAKDVYVGDQAAIVVDEHLKYVNATQALLLDIAKAEDTDDEDAALLKKLAAVAGMIKDQADAVKLIAKKADGSGPKFGAAREKTQQALMAVTKETTEYFQE